MRRLIKGLVIMSLVSSSGVYADDAYINISGGIGRLRNIERSNLPVSKTVDIKMIEPNAINIDFGKSKHFNFALGKSFDSFRSEVDIGYMRAKYKQISQTYVGIVNPLHACHKQPLFADWLSGGFKAFTALANFYYDFKFNNHVVPYVGFGIGMGKITNRMAARHDELSYIQKGKISETKPVYQSLAGIRLNLDENIWLNVGYRYFGTTKLKGLDKKIYSQSVNVGLSYYF